MTHPHHFLDIDDMSRSELHAVFSIATDHRGALKRNADHSALTRRTLGMIFEKPSTRTRVSFETAMTQLGGHAIFLGPDDMQLGRGEPLHDTSRALSRYVDAIMVRLFSHDDLDQIARFASVPVINGLSDRAHPCQTLADLLTIRDHFDGFDGVAVAWIGDGNNVARSFAIGCAMAGITLTIATPEGYGVGEEVLDRAADIGRRPTTTTDPVTAATDADVIYTDTWISMGQEADRAEKLRAFDGFQIDATLLSHAPAAVVMHCLPAHRGEEITDAIIESDRSIVWEQAENRLHAQKGLLCFLIDHATNRSIEL